MFDVYLSYICKSDAVACSLVAHYLFYIHTTPHPAHRTAHSLHVLGTLRLRRLTSCRVVCGPVRGPIYVEGCKDCVVVAAGRQVSHFYLHTKNIDVYEVCM